MHWSEIIHMISKSNERAPLRQRQRILQKCVPHVQHETLVLSRWENETWKILEGDFSSVSPSPWRRANAPCEHFARQVSPSSRRRANARCFLGSRDGVVVIALASHLRGLGSSDDWVKLVVGSLLCSERFFSGFSGFPSPQKSTFPNSNSIGCRTSLKTNFGWVELPG